MATRRAQRIVCADRRRYRAQRIQWRNGFLSLRRQRGGIRGTLTRDHTEISLEDQAPPSQQHARTGRLPGRSLLLLLLRLLLLLLRLLLLLLLLQQRLCLPLCMRLRVRLLVRLLVCLLLQQLRLLLLLPLLLLRLRLQLLPRRPAAVHVSRHRDADRRALLLLLRLVRLLLWLRRLGHRLGDWLGHRRRSSWYAHADGRAGEDARWHLVSKAKCYLLWQGVTYCGLTKCRLSNMLVIFFVHEGERAGTPSPCRTSKP